MEKQYSIELTDELIGKITGYMRVGADFILAAAACGVPEKLAVEWEKRSAAAPENQDNIFRRLYEKKRSALAHAEVIALQRLSAEGGSAGAKWLLEKINPEKYGRPSGSGKPPAPGPAKPVSGGLAWETLDGGE